MHTYTHVPYIQVIMVTGDHPITAKAIARMVGIISPGMYAYYNLGDLQNLIFYYARDIVVAT